MTRYLSEETKNKLRNAYDRKGCDSWVASEFNFLSYEISSLKRKCYIYMSGRNENGRNWRVARDGEMYLKKYVLSGRF